MLDLLPWKREECLMAPSNEHAAHREVLPVPDLPPSGLVTFDAKDPDARFEAIEDLRPPTGAPNVLIVMLDDAGFGSSSAFGGPCATPNAERLAAGGLRDNPFPPNPVCSPARAPPPRGRNPPPAGMGGVTQTTPAAPGANTSRPQNPPPPPPT